MTVISERNSLLEQYIPGQDDAPSYQIRLHTMIKGKKSDCGTNDKDVEKNPWRRSGGPGKKEI